MSDPSLALQDAIKFRLEGETNAAVVDGVGAGDPWPRIEIGQGQTIGNRADCYDGSEVFLDLHVWSRPAAGTWAEVKEIAGKVRELLDEAEIPLSGHTLELLTFENTRFLRDPDGTAFHAVMSIRALTQPSD